MLNQKVHQDAQAGRFVRWHFTLALLSMAILFVLLPGCSAAGRPDPAKAFDEITLRSLNDDVPYVRARLAPSFVTPAQAQQATVASDDYIRGLMSQLQLCRSMSVEKTGDPNKVTVVAAAVQGGAIEQRKFDLVYDEKTGWMLAGPARETGPLQTAKPAP